MRFDSVSMTNSVCLQKRILFTLHLSLKMPSKKRGSKGRSHKGMVYNRQTKRWVKRDGKVGQAILKKRQSSGSRRRSHSSSRSSRKSSSRKGSKKRTPRHRPVIQNHHQPSVHLKHSSVKPSSTKPHSVHQVDVPEPLFNPIDWRNGVQRVAKEDQPQIKYTDDALQLVEELTQRYIQFTTSWLEKHKDTVLDVPMTRELVGEALLAGSPEFQNHGLNEFDKAVNDPSLKLSFTENMVLPWLNDHGVIMEPLAVRGLIRTAEYVTAEILELGEGGEVREANADGIRKRLSWDDDLRKLLHV